METKKTNKEPGVSGRGPARLYSGLRMSWPAVLLFAVAAAVVTAVFLVVPVFRNTSFERVGVHLEAWIFFAVIIMSNCRKPLESALKTFVFFLVSQPLIYLLQVPFSPVGWQIFHYYRTWFIWTLCTFPMAFIGWYITKRNWLSVLILAPVLAFLGMTAWQCGAECVKAFPRMLISALFCALQIVLYILAFFPKAWQKAVGIVIAVAAAVIVAVTAPESSLTVSDTLPGEPSFSQGAGITVEDPSVADIRLTVPEEGRIYVITGKHGTTVFTVTDGAQEHRYLLEVYEDGGTEQIRITPADE